MTSMTPTGGSSTSRRLPGLVAIRVRGAMRSGFLVASSESHTNESILVELLRITVSVSLSDHITERNAKHVYLKLVGRAHKV